MRLALAWMYARLPRLAARLGRRGAALLFFALVDVVFAVGLLAITPADLEVNATYRFAAALLPPALWAILWGGVGVACLVQAFQRVDRIAFGLSSLIKVVWCLTLSLGWLLGEIPRGYVAAVIWLGFAGFVQVIAGWRENEDR